MGNVLVTVSDRKLQQTTDNQTVAYYTADVASATDYYPFGMSMPGRKYNQGGYRYGFNGKENDDEVKGEGNQIDFGSRVYDSRIGRFLSVDPQSSQNISESNYVYANSNPVLMIDRDGENGEVSIVRNKDGKGGVITIKTTVYVTGHDVEKNIQKINLYMSSDKGKGAFSGAYKDLDGNNWKINLSITYKQKLETDKVEEGKGDNILTLKNDESIAVAGLMNGKRYPDKAFITKQGYSRRKLIGQNASIGLKSYSTSTAITALHEVFHLLGLDERYNSSGDNVGFSGDVMSYTPTDPSPLKINQVHFNNWGRFLLSESVRLGKKGTPADEFILKHEVDKDEKNTIIGTYSKDAKGNIVPVDKAKNLGYDPSKSPPIK